MRDSVPSDGTGPEQARSVVALGASAGGLDALDRFFARIDPNLDAAFIVIQHLAPSHKTMMDGILSRQTAMNVRVAQEGDALHAREVYVIPSGVTLTLIDGHLHLDPRPKSGLAQPINAFFHSLGDAAYDRIFGIVLSGTGSDGSQGLQTVVDAGGWALVQNPASAAFDGMPLNAMATGLAHETGAPEELADFVECVIREKRTPEILKLARKAKQPVEATLSQIGKLIDIELANYKPQTLVRRLERRILATGQSEIEGYLALLTSDKDEAARLRREMMIPVTAFFRDKEAFEDLTQQVIRPDMLKRLKNPHAVYRIWSVACATGQEAYSVAILALEAMRDLRLDGEVKVFATDIEPSYLAEASAGIFPEPLLQNLPAELRARYFNPVEDGKYQVSTRLRRAIVFSRHDVLNDPPFLNLDLVICRNMIIYLKPEPQERALRRMLFGLRPGGALFMGGSEAPGRLASLLDPISARAKLFRLRGELRHLSSHDFLTTSARPANGQSYRQSAYSSSPPLSGGADALSPAASCLIKAFAPPAVVIDTNREIRHVFGDMSPFLRIKPGDASLDLMQLLPARVAAIVSTFIFSVMNHDAAMKSVIIHPDADEDFGLDVPVNIEIRPITQPGQEAPAQILISFERLRRLPGDLQHSPQTDDIAALSANRVSELEQELTQLRATLKTTIEELGSVNEELQAGNEELMASNQELQSTNEELQSVNEELQTVNAELQEKILQLNEAYADLETLSRAAKIPLIFLDGLGRITRFSAQATKIFRLRDTDIGRPLTDITHKLSDFDLEACITKAQSDDAPLQQEISGRDGRTWLFSIQPFATRAPEDSRMVLSFIDISSVQTMHYLQSIIDAAPQNLAVLDAAGEIVMVNRAWQSFALDNGGTTALASAAQLNYLEVLRHAALTDPTAARALAGIEKLLKAQTGTFSIIYPCHGPDAQRWFMMHAAALHDSGCVVTHLDITNLHIPEREASTA